MTIISRKDVKQDGTAPLLVWGYGGYGIVPSPVRLQWGAADRVALRGTSNGGLLMGAMIVQHPELARAVVSEVGVYDPLRAERFPNGTFNVTEFGSVANPEQFRALYAY